MRWNGFWNFLATDQITIATLNMQKYTLETLFGGETVVKKIIYTSGITVILGLSLSACVTSGSAGGLNSESAMIAKNVLAEMCSFTRTQGSNVRSKKASFDEIYISSLNDLPNGGVQATAYFHGHGTNVYYNLINATGDCGDTLKGPMRSDFLVSYLAKQGITPAPFAEHTRSIAVNWEGYAELFSGTIVETGGGKAGTVKITLPNKDGKCTGNYQATSRAGGTWKIECTNDLKATGTFTAFGDGKGASGTGKDALGRTVTYTVGGRT